MLLCIIVYLVRFENQVLSPFGSLQSVIFASCDNQQIMISYFCTIKLDAGSDLILYFVQMCFCIFVRHNSYWC